MQPSTISSSSHWLHSLNWVQPMTGAMYYYDSYVHMFTPEWHQIYSILQHLPQYHHKTKQHYGLYSLALPQIFNSFNLNVSVFRMIQRVPAIMGTTLFYIFLIPWARSWYFSSCYLMHDYYIYSPCLDELSSVFAEILKCIVIFIIQDSHWFVLMPFVYRVRTLVICTILSLWLFLPCCLLLYFWGVSLLYSLIMWFAVASLSPQRWNLMFFWDLSIIILM